MLEQGDTFTRVDAVRQLEDAAYAFAFASAAPEAAEEALIDLFFAAHMFALLDR